MFTIGSTYSINFILSIYMNQLERESERERERERERQRERE